MANTNNLEFLGREGLTTLLDQVNTTLTYAEKATQTTRTLTTPPNITIDEEHIFCYGDGKLVCLSNEPNVGSEATVTYSEDDGTTWREGTWSDPLAADKTCPGAVVYGDGIFLGGWSDTESYIIRSTDGINWEIIAITGFSGEHCSALYFHNHKFYCKGDEGTLFRSDDGITWESFFEPGPGGIHNIAFGEDKILVAEYDSPTLTILDYSGNTVGTHQFVCSILGVYCYEDRFYVNIDDFYPLYTSIDGVSWDGIDAFEGSIDTLVYLNGKYFIESDQECYLFDPVADQVTLLTDGIQYSFISSYIVQDRYALTIEDTDIYGTIDGYTWTNPIIEYTYHKMIQQAGKDVTEDVAKLVGGNGGGGNVDLENATLENLTITGALTIEGDLAFGDLDVTTVTAEKVVVSSDPVDDNDVATKKYVDEHSGGGAGSGSTYTVSVKTSGATSGTYLKDSAGNEQKILNLYDITTTSSESSITNGRNTSLGTGIKLSQVFGSGHTIGNNLSASLIRGQGHTISADVNHVDVSGYKNTVNGDYNTIHGTEFNVTGTHNVTFGVGGNCTINGKANMMAGDLTGSTIIGNYNTILCGGGQNSITGTASDPCQHNVILGSTTTLTSAENCLTLGRLNTINNHDRAVLMGIGLTATRDNQLIVGSYNDNSKKGGAFVVGNGSADWGISDTYFNGQYITHSLFIETSYEEGDTLTIITADGVVRDILTYTDNGLESRFISANGKASLSYGAPDLIISNDDAVTIDNPLQCKVYKNLKTSNAMIVYKEGTVTIGHDPIGPMDVATKQYVDSHSGGVDEAQVRSIVEDVLLNGAW